MTLVAPREIVSAHSPDSDDAFMFYGLATKKSPFDEGDRSGTSCLTSKR